MEGADRKRGLLAAALRATEQHLGMRVQAQEARHTHTCWLLVWHKLAPKPAVFDHPVGVPVACIMENKRRDTHRDPAPGGAREVLAHSPVVPWWPFTSTERS